MSNDSFLLVRLSALVPEHLPVKASGKWQFDCFLTPCLFPTQTDHIRCTQVIDPQKPQAQHYSSSGRWKQSLPLIYYPMHICQICMSWHHVKEKNWKGQLGAASHEKAVMSLPSQAGGSHDIGETWNVFYDEQQLWRSLSRHLSALSRVTASWAFWKLICFYSSFKYNLWM